MEIHEEFRPTVHGTGHVMEARLEAILPAAMATPEVLAAAVEKGLRGAVEDIVQAAAGRLCGYVLTALWENDDGQITSATAQMLSLAEWPCVADAVETAYRQAAEAAESRTRARAEQPEQPE